MPRKTRLPPSPDASGLRGGERRLGPLTDQAALQLRDGGEHRQDECARRPRRKLRQIAENQTGLAGTPDDRQQEGGVTRQPVQLGDDQCRATRPAGAQGERQLRPIPALAGLDLLEFRDDRAGAAATY